MIMSPSVHHKEYTLSSGYRKPVSCQAKEMLYHTEDQSHLLKCRRIALRPSVKPQLASTCLCVMSVLLVQESRTDESFL